MSPTATLNVDHGFITDCLGTAKQVGKQSPVSPADTLVSSTASDISKLSLSDKGAGVISNATRLTKNYPKAYGDFYGSGTPCVYKSGPEWPGNGANDEGVYREARPVYGHPIGSAWMSIGKNMCDKLDSIGVKWTCINPLAYANAGEAKPFCPLIIYIGVMPYSLVYDDAVAAAAEAKQILSVVGFGDIEVAFVESITTRSVATGPKLLSFDPLLDEVPALRKPFTSTLGLSIAPRKHPHFEGTAALYLRLSSKDDRVVVLTCAHVARPPPVYPNTGLTRTNSSQPREEIVALGNMGYDKALNDIMSLIGSHCRSIDVWNDELKRLGEPAPGEAKRITARRNDNLQLVEKARNLVEQMNTLHDEVTKRRSTLDQRVIGFVLHSDKIEVSAEPGGFTSDWALIELYSEKFDWSTFKGNKVYVGGNISPAEYGGIMFPQPADRATYRYPQDGLLQAYGIVPDEEIRNPQHLDSNNEECLLVVKNGLATGTTFGRANGLESFTRRYVNYGIESTSIEIAVLPYDRKRGKFSDSGDSGAIVLTRSGGIVGMVTGGSGPTEETDISYITPYWWLHKRIKAKFPDYYLYSISE